MSASFENTYEGHSAHNELPEMSDAQSMSHHGITPLNVVDEEIDLFGLEDDSEQDAAGSPLSEWAQPVSFPTSGADGATYQGVPLNSCRSLRMSKRG
eukprot:762822-Hanusia_phi.AAC.14